MRALEVVDLVSGYGDVQVLRSVSLHVEPGEVVAVLGPNGAGKTTLANTIVGLNRAWHGRVRLFGRDVADTAPHRMAQLGLTLVPEGRRLFPFMTVRENLLIGAYTERSPKKVARRLEWVCEMFPRLRERLNQQASSLSGGEQQMCAIARALMVEVRVLILDEPSLGLAPVVVDGVFSRVSWLASQGVSVLIIEQHVDRALRLANRAYVLEQGEVVLEGPSAELLQSEHLRAAYLGT